MQEQFLQAIVPGGGAHRMADNLHGLFASGYPADTITDSAVAEIATAQYLDGRWASTENQHRPPLMQSHFASTTRVIRMLRDYEIPARKQEFAQRIERARAWLLNTKPVTTEDQAMRLSGLVLSGASGEEIGKAAKAVLALQRPDGGWGGNPHMRSDAYATAGALLALAESKVIKVADPAYKKGMDYLLSTQFPDGAWHVRSRAIKFQPYSRRRQPPLPLGRLRSGCRHRSVRPQYLPVCANPQECGDARPLTAVASPLFDRTERKEEGCCAFKDREDNAALSTKKGERFSFVFRT
jgi:hypothetical protein